MILRHYFLSATPGNAQHFLGPAGSLALITLRCLHSDITQLSHSLRLLNAKNNFKQLVGTLKGNSRAKASCPRKIALPSNCTLNATGPLKETQTSNANVEHKRQTQTSNANVKRKRRTQTSNANVERKRQTQTSNANVKRECQTHLQLCQMQVQVSTASANCNCKHIVQLSTATVKRKHIVQMFWQAWHAIEHHLCHLKHTLSTRIPVS